MRFVILGAGRIGLAHVDTLMKLDGVSALFIADLDSARAAAAAATVQGAAFGTIDEAFSWKPDGIVIAAPTSVHAELIVRAVQAGIPTFCEKPLAESLTSTLAVVEEVERHDVPVQIGFQRRFDAGYVEARRSLAAGEFGELRRMHMVTCDPTPPPAEYVPVSGGLYRDCHIHDFDILRWVTGQEVASVFATGSNRGAEYFAASGDIDESATILTLNDGTLVTLQGSRYNGAGYDVRMELAGTRGNRTVGLDERVPLTSTEPGVDFPSGTPWGTFQERFTDAYREELAAFVTVVHGTTPARCTPRDALEALYIAEAASLSRVEGRVVMLAEVRASARVEARI
ncbi:dehydrogenase [Cryobacterium sp. MLB-32]|uniref:Gfo/Idh/MocA family protein n=1 Tax=Cryobacterium sp. MLB-32 TaxID=1529318 RepID=UPI0004E7A1A3|nr:Gfo/Idh/MocA family oxidoreductase [Cryobacterium sp. MLB-32]KFF58777.1 dehydrogenase [Cryobacterium sp. MLB-32]